MIFIVDEDVVQMSSLKTELQFRGYSVEMLPNADEAWFTISKHNDVELIIIDIMLSAKPTQESRFNREVTKDYTITGICLAEDFLQQYSEKLSNKIIYLSHTNENGLLNLIEKSSGEKSIPFFRKHHYASDMKLAEDILNSITLPLEKK